MILFRRKDRGGVKREGEGREESGSQPHLEVNLEGLRTMVDRLHMDKESSSRNGGVSTSSVREAIQIAKRFNQHIDSLKYVSEGLQRRRISADIPTQLKGIIERARSTVSSVIVEVIKPIPEPSGINDIVLIQESARRVLNRIGDASGSHRRILYEFFPVEARALKDILMAMKKDIDALDGIARGIDEHVSSYSRCRDRIARLMKMEQEIKVYNARMREMRSTLNTLEERMAEVERKRVGVCNEQEYIELTNMLSKARMEYDRLLSDIARDFSRLSRAVSKYAYEIGFDREQYAVLKAVMDEPARLRDVRVDVVRDALARLRDGITSGRLHLKNPEKDLENIQSLMDVLERYIGMCNEYEGMMSVYRERIAPYEDTLKGIDVELERIGREIRRVRDTLQDYAGKVSTIRSTMDAEVEQLKDDVYRLYGLRVRITVDFDNS